MDNSRIKKNILLEGEGISSWLKGLVMDGIEIEWNFGRKMEENDEKKKDINID